MGAAADILIRGLSGAKLSTGDLGALRDYLQRLDDSASSANAVAVPGATRAMTVRRMVVDGDLAVPAGNITVGPVATGKGNVIINTSGLRTRLGTVEKIKLGTLGDVFIGSDLSAPASTYFSIFSIQQNYNSENFLAGDMLIGDNSASKANIKWDKANGTLNFRGGTTAQVQINTSGQLTAGGGIVQLDANGISLTAPASFAPANNITWYNGSNIVGDIRVAYLSPLGQSLLGAYGTAASDNSTVTLLVGSTVISHTTRLDIHHTGSSDNGYAALWDTNTLVGLTLGANAVPSAVLDVRGPFLAGGQTQFRVLGAADTAQASENIDANFNLARTVTINTSYATQRGVALQAPTYAGSAATKTITTAVTLDIDNAPQVGANAAITTAYALRVQAGNVLLAGGLNVGSATSAATGEVRASSTDGSVRVDKDDNAGHVELHVRPNSGKSGWVTFTENGVADRWIVGVKNGNASLWFATGSPGTSVDEAHLDNNGDLTINGVFVGANAAAANGSVATVLGSLGPAGSHTTVQGWLKVTISGTARYIPCF